MRFLLLVGALVLSAFATKVSAAADEMVYTRDVIYGHKDGMALTYDVVTPANSNGAGVIFMVSGGWMSYWRAPEERLRGFAGLLNAGFTVFAVHHGSAPRYKVPDAVSDVRAAVRHIKASAIEYNVSSNRLGVYGGSAGGHLSLMLGLNSEGEPMAPEKSDLPSVLAAPNPNYKAPAETDASLAAVVAFFPPVDLREWTESDGRVEQIPAIDFDAGLAASVSPILFVDKNDPPIKLIHGDEDKLVPLRHSTSIKTVLDEQGVVNDLLVIEGGGHGFRGEDGITAGTAMIEWFSEHLLK